MIQKIPRFSNAGSHFPDERIIAADGRERPGVPNCTGVGGRACFGIANKIGPCFHFSSQCAICLRIGDFQRMTKDNVSVSPDGIPYENKNVLLY